MDIEENLNRLAVEACQHPIKSRQRQLALTKIIQMLQQPGILKQSAGITQEQYLEARHNLSIYICEKIDNFDPQKGSFLRWAQSNFKWRKRDVMWGAHQPNFDSLESLCDHDRNWEEILGDRRFAVTGDSLVDGFRKLIKDDPDHKFREAHIRNKPDVTFQIIVILKDIDGLTLKDISQKFDVPIPTLSSFYQRRIAEFKLYIQDYLLNH